MIKNTWNRDHEGNLFKYDDDRKVNIYDLDKDFSNPKLYCRKSFCNFSTSFLSGMNLYDNINLIQEINDDSLWINDFETVSNISPLMAYGVVKSLGFKGVKETYTESINLQSVDDWWNELPIISKNLFSFKFNLNEKMFSFCDSNYIYCNNNDLDYEINNIINEFNLNEEELINNLKIDKSELYTLLNNLVLFINSNEKILNL